MWRVPFLRYFLSSSFSLLSWILSQAADVRLYGEWNNVSEEQEENSGEIFTHAVSSTNCFIGWVFFSVEGFDLRFSPSLRNGFDSITTS